jgi:hypothetical protein
MSLIKVKGIVKIKGIVIKNKRFDLDNISYEKFYNRLGHCKNYKDDDNCDSWHPWSWECNISRIGEQTIKLVYSITNKEICLFIDKFVSIDNIPRIYFIDIKDKVYDLKEIVKEYCLKYVMNNKNYFNCISEQLFCNMRISIGVGLYSNNVSVFIK